MTRYWITQSDKIIKIEDWGAFLEGVKKYTDYTHFRVADMGRKSLSIMNLYHSDGNWHFTNAWADAEVIQRLLTIMRLKSNG